MTRDEEIERLRHSLGDVARRFRRLREDRGRPASSRRNRPISNTFMTSKAAMGLVREREKIRERLSELGFDLESIVIRDVRGAEDRRTTSPKER